MFNKKALSLAVAAAATGLSLSAMAQINVSTGTGKIAIANESVTPTTTGVLPVGTGATSGALNVTGKIGVGVSGSDQVFIRFDWSGAKLNSAFSGSAVSVAGVGGTTVTNGLAGDSNAIFGVTALTAGFSQTAGVVLTQGTSGVSLTGQSSNVRMRVFENQTNAINEISALSDQSATGAITLGDALSTKFTPANATAEVTTNFTQFTAAGVQSSTGTLGSFTASASTAFVVAAGLAPVTGLANLVSTTSSVVTYAGDFSFATSGATPYGVAATTAGCGGAITAVTVNTTSFASATSTVAAANGAPLCITVNGTTEEIPESAYEATVNLVHAVTTSSPNKTTSVGSIGETVRNGTTVEVAYLTTFEDYNQRLLINSRHNVAAMYNITFQTEDGTTATPTALATGMLAPNENLVLKARDLVTLTGSTRCSATVTVVAPSGNISVATTQVNLSDASTDTVSYN